jgi:ligand-binding sensor domain-containing protein
MMRKSRAFTVQVSLAGLLILAALVGLAFWRASDVLRAAQKGLQSEREIRFVARPLAPTVNSGFEPVSSPAVFSLVARFENNLYIAGPYGLQVYEPSGRFVRSYVVGRELPGSALVAITAAVLADSKQPELVIATAADGVLAFDGRSFRQIYAQAADARAITAILATPAGHLLIGTKKRGVLVYDGRQITLLHSTLSDCYVTALAGNESDLWVGTLDRGVLHLTGGQTDSFKEEQGLPDSQVTSLATLRETTYVGTPLGVAVFSKGQFARVLARGVLATALLGTANQLYVGSEDQGVISIPLDKRPTGVAANAGAELPEVRQIFALEDSIFAVTRGGLYRLKPHAFGWQQVLQPGTAMLTDRNVSALAADGGGHLWIGYFDRGLDVIALDARHATHLEDEHLFCINRIFPNTKTGGVDVATANGLVRFDQSGKPQQVLTRADGLIAENVADVVAYGDGVALATPAGLTFLDSTGARSMYAFQGLVNNHVYALAASGDQLMAGTLGGISILDKGNVSANYTTANSNLKHNWITAVVSVGSEWMVGTYGAGVLGLDRSGHFHTFDVGSGNFEVNPNAMLVTPAFVLAGSLGTGLYLYDRTSGRWSVIEQGLPSLNVTALACANGYIYIGTDNGLVRIPARMLHS